MKQVSQNFKSGLLQIEEVPPPALKAGGVLVRTARLNNFESLDLFEGTRQSRVRGRGIDKGQKQETEAFVSAVKTGAAMPIPVDELIDTTRLTLAAVESLRTGQPVNLAGS